MRLFIHLLLVLLTVFPAIAAEKEAPSTPQDVDDVDLLELDLKISRFLVRHVSPNLEPETRLQALTSAIFDKKGLGITYEDSGTRGAIETFKARSGNCLSFTILFVAMARHLGLNAHFQEVGEVMSWDQRGDVVLRNHHMFAEVEVENGRIKVDFLPEAGKTYREVRRVDEQRVLAHYYNNLGAETLAAAGGAELALAYFQKALEADPSFAHAWTNLGVAHRHLGDFDQAEQSYLKAIEINNEPTATTNLASLYLAAGRGAEAEPLLEEVQSHLRRNPFHHFQLGSKASREGDPCAAIRHFREAIRRSSEQAEFHAALASALVETGQLGKARESFQRALKLADDNEQRQQLKDALAALPTLPGE